MNNLGLSIENTSPREFKILGGNKPIMFYLRDDYRNNINSLKAKNIIYLEQCLYSNLTIKEWRNISLESEIKYKGKVPNWWPLLKERIIGNKEERIIQKEVKTEIKRADISMVNSIQR